MRGAHPLRPIVLAAVALGGAAGALARWALTTALPDTTGFPWTVFCVNVAGCFLLALLPAFPVVRRRHLLPPLLGTGLLGGFTTLSTYAEQTRALAATGHVAVATGYALGTVAAALVAVAVADLLSTRAQRADFEADEGEL